MQLPFPVVVEDALRLPILVLHFVEHGQKQRDLTLFHFLKDHYSNSHPTEEHDDHGDLPFHSHSDFSTNQNAVINFEIKIVKFAPSYYFKEAQKISFLQKHFPSKVLLSIWRPPKSC